MRIFSNFDTCLRREKFTEYQKEYGPERVVCFWRSRLYLRYRVLFPALIILLISFLWLKLFSAWFGSDYLTYVLVFTIALLVVLFFPIIGRFIDYKQDFIIVVPEALMLYDQGGILKRNIITISSRSIKTISVRKSGLLYSIFNNGDILVLSEGDMNDGEVTLRWVPHPDKRRQQILQIIGLDQEWSEHMF